MLRFHWKIHIFWQAGEVGGLGQFSSQCRVLLMWQELFISSTTTIYLTVPLLYPTPSELLGQLLPRTEQFSLCT